jgi:hypothetical protein
MNGRLNALRGREFETPPGNGRYLRIAGIDCVVFAPRQTPRC